MFFRLDYPRAYEKLPAVREAVLAHSAKLGSTLFRKLV
jgi:hypothetical protein